MIVMPIQCIGGLSTMISIMCITPLVLIGSLVFGVTILGCLKHVCTCQKGGFASVCQGAQIGVPLALMISFIATPACSNYVFKAFLCKPFHVDSMQTPATTGERPRT